MVALPKPSSGIALPSISSAVTRQVPWSRSRSVDCLGGIVCDRGFEGRQINGFEKEKKQHERNLQRTPTGLLARSFLAYFMRPYFRIASSIRSTGIAKM